MVHAKLQPILLILICLLNPAIEFVKQLKGILLGCCLTIILDLTVNISPQENHINLRPNEFQTLLSVRNLTILFASIIKPVACQSLDIICNLLLILVQGTIRLGVLTL